MADRHFRSSAISGRAKSIIDMVKGKPVTTSIELSPNKNLETTNNSKPELDPTDYVNNIYLTSGSIFDTFCETQTTYNSYHLLNLDTSKLKQALFNESTVHQTVTKHVVNTPIEVDLTCNELMPADDFPVDKEVQLNTKGTCENSPPNFDSDDSVLDKDYCPSNSSESPMSDVSEKGKKIKKNRLQTGLSTDVTMNLTPSINKIQTLERKRRDSIGATCYEKTTLKRPYLRRRSNAVDGNYCATLPEIPQPSRKRKKYDTPLQQRKLDAKNLKRRAHSVKPGCNEKCLRKCMTLLNQEDREAINKAYWDMSWQEQHAFVEAHTHVAIPKRKITSEPKRKPKRNFVFKKQDGTKKEDAPLTILQRITIEFSDSSIAHRMNQSENVKKFDVIAVVPKTLSAFQYACGSMDIDIITFRPESKLPFKLNRKLYRLAADRGIFFELMYAPAIRDATSRKNIINTAHMFHSIGKSRNIILSSAAESHMQLRGVYDLLNLGVILGLNENQCRQALTENARKVLLKCEVRRCGKSFMYITSNADSEMDETQTKKRKLLL